MTMRPDILYLLRILRDPGHLRELDHGQWSALITSARKANLLGTLANRIKDFGTSVDARVQRHLDGALHLSNRQQQSVKWEVHQLQKALRTLQIPVVLLKGAAYAISNHATARGRLFGDIDILVPHASLGDVESRLMLAGWISAKTSSYDQRYYREWMHELPPMSHIHRGTVLDVHHSILPLTARNSPDPMQIIGRATPVSDPNLSMLCLPCPEDLVIHSITHLVHEGELHNGLRDLCDIDCMVRSFQSLPSFWSRFTACTSGNDLASPVWFGLKLAKKFFNTPIPDNVLNQLAPAKSKMDQSSRLLMVYEQALQAANDPNAGSMAAICKLLVYIRAHALRMPFPLLARHLVIKGWKGWRDTQAASNFKSNQLSAEDDTRRL